VAWLFRAPRILGVRNTSRLLNDFVYTGSLLRTAPPTRAITRAHLLINPVLHCQTQSGLSFADTILRHFAQDVIGDGISSLR
jgi:hypothetical protein